MAQVTLVTTASIDTQIYSLFPTTNYGNRTTILAIGNSLYILMEFDLSSIPSQAFIVSATLGVTKAVSANGTLDVFRLVRNWVENQATWNIAETAINWGTAGAENTTSDTDGVSLGNIALTGATNSTGTLGITSLVQDWYSGASDNYGVKLEIVGGSANIEIYSSEHGSGTKPTLTVVYNFHLDYQLNSTDIDSGIQANWLPIVTGKSANATQKVSTNWRRHTWSMATCEMSTWEVLEPTRGTSFSALKTTGHSVSNTVNTYSTGRVLGVTGRQVGRRMENVKVEFLIDITS